MSPLIVLGGSVRAAAFSALRAGFEPYAIDLFSDRDLASACPAIKINRFPQDFLPALAAAPHAPWLYTGGLENYPRLVDRLASIRPLWGNPGIVLRGVRDPLRLSDVLRIAGVSVPALWPATPLVGRGAANLSWLVKPRRSSGGLAIRFATQEDFNRPPPGAYLQRFIDGQAASAVYVGASGRATLLGVSRQLLGRDFGLDRLFLHVGSLAPLLLREAEAAKLHALGDSLTAHFGLVGLFNVDFVQTADELWIVEVNPRYSASVEVLERVTGLDFMGLHGAACEQRRLPSVATTCSGFYGKAVVYAEHDAAVTSELNVLVADWNRPGQPPLVADLPRIGQRFAAGQPVVTVFANGDSTAQIEERLRDRMRAVWRVMEIHNQVPFPTPTPDS